MVKIWYPQALYVLAAVLLISICTTTQAVVGRFGARFVIHTLTRINLISSHLPYFAHTVAMLLVKRRIANILIFTNASIENALFISNLSRSFPHKILKSLIRINPNSNSTT